MFQTAALRFGFLALAVAAACQPADPVEAPAASTTQIVSPSLWGEEAITWTDALTQLPRDRGGEAWGYFWAPHLLFDYRSMVPGSNVMRRAEAIGLIFSPTCRPGSPLDSGLIISEERW